MGTAGNEDGWLLGPAKGDSDFAFIIPRRREEEEREGERKEGVPKTERLRFIAAEEREGGGFGLLFFRAMHSSFLASSAEDFLGVESWDHVGRDAIFFGNSIKMHPVNKKHVPLTD